MWSGAGVVLRMSFRASAWSRSQGYICLAVSVRTGVDGVFREQTETVAGHAVTWWLIYVLTRQHRHGHSDLGWPVYSGFILLVCETEKLGAWGVWVTAAVI